MFKTCMFCKKPLGSNEVLESFAIGRRLAFDAAKGRLWVVCRSCQRWNLTPLEERWEAVEDCERLFRETPMRSSTENIGIARHRGGLDLVRIGKPRRGEFAAWRYGDQFKRRYRMTALGSVGAFGFSLAIVTSPIAIPTGLLIGGTWAWIAWSRLRPLAKVRLGAGGSDGGPVTPEDVAVFRYRALRSMRLLPDEDESGFVVEVKKGRRRNGSVLRPLRPRRLRCHVPLMLWGGGRRWQHPIPRSRLRHRSPLLNRARQASVTDAV